MEAGRRTGSVALGIVLIVAGVLWTLFWGLIALLASAFGGDTGGWVIVSVALAFGVFGFVLGVCLVRGRPPNRWGWAAVGAAVLALLALPLGAWSEDREAAPVNRAVQRAYMKQSGLKNVTADCNQLDPNPDGSESWICELGFEADYDVCLADVTRAEGRIAARVHGCLNDKSER